MGKGHMLPAMRRVALMVGTTVCVTLYYVALSTSRLAESKRSSYHVSRSLLFRSDDSSNSDSSPVSRWAKFDWLPQRDRGSLLEHFVEHEHTPQWNSGERLWSCDNKESDRMNHESVSLIRRHLSSDYIQPVADPSTALPLLEKVVLLQPDCWTAKLNLAILTPVVDHSKKACHRMEQLLREFPEDSPLRGKALLWTAIMIEHQGGRDQEAHEFYVRALEKSPLLGVQYFGKKPAVLAKMKKPVSLLKDTRMHDSSGIEIERSAMAKLLLYAEFAKHFSGYGHITREQALAFHDVWFTLIKGLIPPYVVHALQECYRELISRGILKFNDKQARRYYHYNSPPSRFVASVLTQFVSNFWDTEMQSTYSYMGAYPSGSELKPHVDRQQCELTMSVAVDVNPAEETCPIGARLQPKQLTKSKSVGTNDKPSDPKKAGYLYPHIGDAVLFRGRGIVHWRDEIPEGMNCTNIFLHWVRSDFEGKID